MIAPNIIIPLASNSIPAGFVEETSLNDNFIMGSSIIGANATGGSITHTHTFTSSHNHASNAHTHTFSVNDSTNAETVSDTGISASTGLIITNHDHGSGTSGAIASFSCNSVTPSCTTVNHEPANVVLKFIKSTGYNFLPNNGVELRTDANANLQECNGSNGSVNLQDRFIKGGTYGTSSSTTSHTHTVAHTHTISHAHSSVTSSTPVYSYIERKNYGVSNPSFPARKDHKHTVYFDTHTNSSVSDSRSSSSTTQEPPYYTLRAFQNVSGTPKLPQIGMIAMLLSSPTPIGWKLCDGEGGTPNLINRFIKISSSSGSTGGSNTHTHNTISHNHSYSHTHNGSTSGMDRDGIEAYRGGNNEGHIKTHTHPVTVNSSTMTTTNTTITFNSATSLPEYRTVAFIQFEYAPVIPNPIIGMLIDKL